LSRRESRIGPELPRRAAGLGRFPRRTVAAPQARRLRLRTRILRGDRGFDRDQAVRACWVARFVPRDLINADLRPGFLDRDRPVVAAIRGFDPQILSVVLRHRRTGRTRGGIGGRREQVGTD
jgi:hypothetical protein